MGKILNKVLGDPAKRQQAQKALDALAAHQGPEDAEWRRLDAKAKAALDELPAVTRNQWLPPGRPS